MAKKTIVGITGLCLMLLVGIAGCRKAGPEGIYKTKESPYFESETLVIGNGSAEMGTPQNRRTYKVRKEEGKLILTDSAGSEITLVICKDGLTWGRKEFLPSGTKSW